jgi:HAD superfamily phosphoserine phosphatase-like hydrolase
MKNSQETVLQAQAISSQIAGKLDGYAYRGVSAFDADGTLWHHDIAEEFTQWCFQKNYLATADEWGPYRKVYEQDSRAGVQLLLSFYRGNEESRIASWVDEFWTTVQRPWITSVTDLVQHLAANGEDVWVVTASPRIVLEPIKKHLPVTRILGLEFELDSQGLTSGKPVGLITSGEGKAEALRSQGITSLGAGAGNSMSDVALIRMAERVQWAINPCDEMRAIANEESWMISEISPD